MLLYHRILPEGASPGRGGKAVPADRFREHLHLLDRWGFTPITFRDYQLILEGALTPPRKPIILTFDDGYEDTYSVAVPLLQQYGMRAVMFVLGGAGATRNAWDDGLGIPPAALMNEQNILELHAMGFEIGSHSLTHPRLPMLPREQAWEEISRSRMRLEITLNDSVRAFAYPYGLLNETLKSMVASSGYAFACSAWSGPTRFTSDPYEIRRLEITSHTNTAEFAFKVLGPYREYRWLQSKARTLAGGRPAPKHVSQGKSLLMVSAGLGWPDRAGFGRREAADEYPRTLPFLQALNADVLDERFLASAPARRRVAYRSLGVNLAQVFEAYAVRKRYDVIVSWAEHLGLPLAGLFRLTRAKTPHVSIFSWISKPKKARILKAVHRSIDRIILMSSAQRDFAVDRLRIPAEKIALLRWPVDEHFWRPLGGTEDIISTVGREMRDFGTLIEALRGTEIPCHIAAGGQLDVGKQDSWIGDIGGSADLPPSVTIGPMKFAELRRLYDRSRFVVIPLYPTDTDNGTTSILEAMAMGKAVICTRVDGQRDVIQEGHTGLFVPPRDPRALREAIEYLWSHPDEAAAMGRNGRARVERYHSLDSWITDVQNVVTEAIAAKHGVQQARTGGSAAPAADAVPQEERTWIVQQG